MKLLIVEHRARIFEKTDEVKVASIHSAPLDLWERFNDRSSAQVKTPPLFLINNFSSTDRVEVGYCD